MKTLLSFLLLTTLLVSCDDLSGSGTGANNQEPTPGQGTIIVKKPQIGGLDFAEVSDNKFRLVGTAENGGNSGHNFRMKFILNDGEKMTFHLFAKRDLSGGSAITFSKEDGVVKFTMSLNGKSDSYNLESLSDNTIDIELDFHNDHSDSHVLVWDKNGPHEYFEECTFEGGCLYNSEDFAFDVWAGVGRASGIFWGFEGNTDNIIKLEGPKDAFTDV